MVKHGSGEGLPIAKKRLTNPGYSFLREALRLLWWCRAANWAGAGVRPLCTLYGGRKAFSYCGRPAKRSEVAMVGKGSTPEQRRASEPKEGGRGGCVGWGAIKAGKVKRSPEGDLVPGGVKACA
jgi:hypothetical protein